MEFNIQDLAWNTFKQTGDINTFMELKMIDNISENIQKNGMVARSDINNITNDIVNNISDKEIKNLDGNNQIEGIGKIN